MAVIGPRIVLLLLLSPHLFASDLTDAHAAISRVADALSDGDAALAIAPISKTCPDYDKLNNDFQALAVAYDIANLIDFEDDDIGEGKATVTAHWTLTLTTDETGFNTTREADLTIKLIHDGKSWKITELQPITIFDPQQPGSRRR